MVDWNFIRKSTYRRLQPRKGLIYLNEHETLDFSDGSYNSHVLVTGFSGKGKSIAAGIIGCQTENFIFLDPVSGAFRGTLSWLGDLPLWKFYELGDLAKPNQRLLINVRDAGKYAIQAVYSRANVPQNERTIRQELFDFFRRSPTSKRKTYAALEAIFTEHQRAMPLWDELKKVFHPLDEGMDILDLQKGRKVVDVSSVDLQSPILGLFIGTILDNREQRFAAGQKMDQLFIALDEFDTNGPSTTATGRSMSYISMFGRKFRLSSVAIGTTEGKIDIRIKNNAAIRFFFENTAEAKEIWNKYRVDISQEYFKRIEEQFGFARGNCFVKADLYGYYEPQVMHLDKYYQEIRNRANKQPVSYRVLNYNEEHHVRKFLNLF